MSINGKKLTNQLQESLDPVSNFNSDLSLQTEELSYITDMGVTNQFHVFEKEYLNMV